jgi:DNA-binding MarR family transcriptional regulator
VHAAADEPKVTLPRALTERERRRPGVYYGRVTPGMTSRRISDATASVLRLFLERPDAEFYGLEVIRLTGIKSGSLYPILGRLESRGVLVAAWEDLTSATERGTRPRRRYQLNPLQHDLAREMHAEWVAAGTPPLTTPRAGLAT